MASISDLTPTLQRLRNAAPQQFEEFRAAFHHYANRVNRDFMLAESKLKQMQGQTQQCFNLLDILEKIK